jgi:uncharacterized protein with gpF-like domain
MNVTHESTIDQIAQQVPNIGLKRQWSAHLDNRTSKICISLDGVVVAIGEPFRSSVKSGNQLFMAPPAHPNCRCSIAYVSTERGKGIAEEINAANQAETNAARAGA